MIALQLLVIVVSISKIQQNLFVLTSRLPMLPTPWNESILFATVINKSRLKKGHMAPIVRFITSGVGVCEDGFSTYGRIHEYLMP